MSRFVWGGTGVILFIWSYFRLPEVWNRPFEELDILFTQKVSARNFAKTNIDIMGENNEILEQAHERDPTYVVA
jgi:SP family general alpha glucoside:H+ symporter-like MFS transporter